MTIPPILLGPGSLVLGLLLTFALPVVRGRFWHRVMDLITLGLFVAGFWSLRIWDFWSNIGVGLIAGVIAVLIRDFRYWLIRLRGQVYRVTHPYYWYGQAYNLWGRRRRRRY